MVPSPLAPALSVIEHPGAAAPDDQTSDNGPASHRSHKRVETGSHWGALSVFLSLPPQCRRPQQQMTGATVLSHMPPTAPTYGVCIQYADGRPAALPPSLSFGESIRPVHRRHLVRSYLAGVRMHCTVLYIRVHLDSRHRRRRPPGNVDVGVCLD